MPDSNYLKIGLFVLACSVLLVAGLLVFGLRGRLAVSTVQCVTLFDRSVQGLSADAAVKFRGLAVGRVTALSLAAAGEIGGQPLVRVDFVIDRDALAAQVRDSEKISAFLRDEIAKGLKVYLTLQGVTGLCFLDLNYGGEPDSSGPAAQAAERIANNGRLVYIPNGPSQIFEIGESINRLLRIMNDIDFIDMSRDIKLAVNNFNRAVAALDAGRLSAELSQTLEEIRALSAPLRTLAGRLDGLVSRAEGGGLVEDLEASAGQLHQSLRRLDQILGSSSGGLPETLNNLRATTENLRAMSELLKNQPSQLIFGQPPRPINPGREGQENVTAFTAP